jgi:hypothetical protein
MPVDTQILKKLDSYFSDIMHVVSAKPWIESLPHIKVGVIDNQDKPQTLSCVITEYKSSRQSAPSTFRQAARRVWKEGGNFTSRVITEFFYTCVIPDLLFELTIISVMVDVVNGKYAFCYGPVRAEALPPKEGEAPSKSIYVVIDGYQRTKVGELASLHSILPDMPVFDFIDEFLECIKLQEEIDGHIG